MCGIYDVFLFEVARRNPVLCGNLESWMWRTFKRLNYYSPWLLHWHLLVQSPRHNLHWHARIGQLFRARVRRSVCLCVSGCANAKPVMLQPTSQQIHGKTTGMSAFLDAVVSAIWCRWRCVGYYHLINVMYISPMIAICTQFAHFAHLQAFPGIRITLSLLDAIGGVLRLCLSVCVLFGTTYIHDVEVPESSHDTDYRDNICTFRFQANREYTRWSLCNITRDCGGHKSSSSCVSNDGIHKLIIRMIRSCQSHPTPFHNYRSFRDEGADTLNSNAQDVVILTELC